MNWLDTLKAIAPTVATAIAGPLGGAAVVAIGSVLGMTEPTQEAIAKVFTDGQLSSADLVKIRQLETEYKTHESEMGFKYADLEYKKDELVAKDRADARNMQIAVHSKMPAVLTIMVTIGFFGVLTALLMMPELKANEIVLVMVGQLSAVWGACVAFYVSTTFSSGSKNAMLAQSAPLK